MKAFINTQYQSGQVEAIFTPTMTLSQVLSAFKNTLIFKTRIRKTINTLSANVGLCSAKVDMEQDYMNAYQKVLDWLETMEKFFDGLVDICDTKIQETENQRLTSSQKSACLIKNLGKITQDHDSAKYAFENALQFNNEWSVQQRRDKCNTIFVDGFYGNDKPCL